MGVHHRRPLSLSLLEQGGVRPPPPSATFTQRHLTRSLLLGGDEADDDGDDDRLDDRMLMAGVESGSGTDADDLMSTTEQEVAVSTLSRCPWWYRLVGGGFGDESTSLAWKIWALVYLCCIWAVNIYFLYLVCKEDFKTNPPVFGVFVVVVPHHDGHNFGLTIAQKFMTVFSSVAHLVTHTWILQSGWRRKGQLYYSTKQKRHFSNRSMLKTMFPTWADRGSAFGLAMYLAMMLLGNKINPGDYNDFVNIVVFGIGGTACVWLPFMVPYAMFMHVKIVSFFLRRMNVFGTQFSFAAARCNSSATGRIAASTSCVSRRSRS